MNIPRAEGTIELNETFEACATRAIEAAQSYLDNEGRIAYGRFDQETRRTLEEGPGYVVDPAEITSYDSFDAFAERSNNFYTVFQYEKSEDEPLHEPAHYQRFRILFPELAQAFEGEVDEYLGEGRRTGNYLMETELMKRMWFAYKIMSQLVDLNDEYYKGQKVRDLSEAQQRSLLRI